MATGLAVTEVRLIATATQMEMLHFIVVVVVVAIECKARGYVNKGSRTGSLTQLRTYMQDVNVCIAASVVVSVVILRATSPLLYARIYAEPATRW